jgi:hypothetical protein
VRWLWAGGSAGTLEHGVLKDPPAALRHQPIMAGGGAATGAGNRVPATGAGNPATRPGVAGGAGTR